MQKIAYDGVGDFAFIGIVANQPNVLVAHPRLPRPMWRSWWPRRGAGQLNYASAGTGGATHLGAEAVAGAVTHVPYAGAAPAPWPSVGWSGPLGMLNLAATRAQKKGRWSSNKSRSISPLLAECGQETDPGPLPPMYTDILLLASHGRINPIRASGFRLPAPSAWFVAGPPFRHATGPWPLARTLTCWEWPCAGHDPTWPR